LNINALLKRGQTMPIYSNARKQETAKQTVVYRIVKMFKDGLLTEKEAIDKLDFLEIRGSFNGENNFFIGYDYKYQEWIEIPY